MRSLPLWFWHVLCFPAWILRRLGYKAWAIRGDRWSSLYVDSKVVKKWSE